MDHRHWPYDPHAPPRDEPAGWVVAGGEQDEWYGQGPPERYRDNRWYDEQYGDRPYGTHDYDGQGYQNGSYGTGGQGSQPYDNEPFNNEPYDNEPYDRRWPAAGYPPPETGPYPGSGAPPPPGPYRPGGREPQPYPYQDPYPDPYQDPYQDPYPDPYPEPQPRPERYDPRTPPRRAQPPPSRSDVRRRLAPEEVPDESGSSWLAALAWALCYFLVPMVLYLGWAFTRSESAAPGCVDDAGAPCLSPRAEALAAFVDVLPALGGAVVLAVLASVVLRNLTAAWRASTVGFAAAVIGAGLATLVASILR